MKVAYLTNLVPAYRTGFFRRLLSDQRLDVTVFCHAEVHGHAVELLPQELRHKLVYCPTTSFFGGAAIFERLPFGAILAEYDVIFCDGNPRHLGIALLSSLAALKRRRVIIGSTLHSRRNRPLTQLLRLGWWRLFPEFLSYTTPDADNLRARFPGKIARSSNNGLDQAAIERAQQSHGTAELAAFKASLGLTGKRIGLSLGRALPGRFDLMAPVLREMQQKDPDFRWILLGGGEGIADLKAELDRCGVAQSAILPGPVHDETELAKWFGIADLFVYTEAIGLSLFHAFGYGLPVIAHADLALHGPEMGAFEEGRTGLTFKRGDARHMSEQIVRLLQDDSERHQMGERARSVVQTQYNAEIMYQRFTQALLDPKAQF